MGLASDDRNITGIAKRVIALLVLLAAYPVSQAEYHDVDDIKAFGLLDIKGHFSAGYLLDDRDRGTGGTSDFERRTTWQEDIFVLTESFIYHPGFLNMDIGAGPLLLQQDYESNLGNVSENDSLVNFLARFNFLDIKNYPFSFYYERTHPSVTTSLAGRFLTQNDVYGFDNHIADLFGGSTTTRLSVSRRESNGSGFGSVVDNTVDLALFSITTSYRKSDSLSLRFDRLEQDSASGSAGLPIVQSYLLQKNGELRAENYFGGDGQILVRQLLRRLQQDRESFDTFALDDRTYQGDVRWQHTDRTLSFLRYRGLDAQRTNSDLALRDAELGFVHDVDEGLAVESSIGQLDEDQTGFQRKESTARGAVTYSKETGFGAFGLSGSVRGKRTDQASSVADIPVFGEPIVLNGTTPVDLFNEFVVSGTVVVSNADRTQIYVEGIDYRLVTIGSVTSVQRLINGNITDGETVLVDYSYETPGTAKYDTLGSGLSLNLRFWQTFDAFVRYDWQDTEIRDGALSNPVNDRNRIEVGIGTTSQFLDGWTLDGQYRHVQNDEEISPFASDTLNLSVTKNLFGTLTVTLAGDVTEVDYENSLEDIQQVSYRIGLSGRLFRRSRFAYDAFFLEDTGGTQQRREVRQRFNYQWAYRQMRFDAQLLYSDERLGLTERGNLHVTATVTRIF